MDVASNPGQLLSMVTNSCMYCTLCAQKVFLFSSYFLCDTWLYLTAYSCNSGSRHFFLNRSLLPSQILQTYIIYPFNRCSASPVTAGIRLWPLHEEITDHYQSMTWEKLDCRNTMHKYTTQRIGNLLQPIATPPLLKYWYYLDWSIMKFLIFNTIMNEGVSLVATIVSLLHQLLWRNH